MISNFFVPSYTVFRFKHPVKATTEGMLSCPFTNIRKQTDTGDSQWENCEYLYGDLNSIFSDFSRFLPFRSSPCEQSQWENFDNLFEKSHLMLHYFSQFLTVILSRYDHSQWHNWEKFDEKFQLKCFRLTLLCVTIISTTTKHSHINSRSFNNSMHKKLRIFSSRLFFVTVR